MYPKNSACTKPSPKVVSGCGQLNVTRMLNAATAAWRKANKVNPSYSCVGCSCHDANSQQQNQRWVGAALLTTAGLLEHCLLLCNSLPALSLVPPSCLQGLQGLHGFPHWLQGLQLLGSSIHACETDRAFFRQPFHLSFCREVLCTSCRPSPVSLQPRSRRRVGSIEQSFTTRMAHFTHWLM
jgi:hypothetical protein